MRPAILAIHRHPVFQTLLAPLECEICNDFVEQPPALCSPCQNRLRPLADSHCEICALPFDGGGLSSHRCQQCLTRPPVFKKVWAGFEFEGSVSSLLHAAKFGRQISALEVLALSCRELFEQAIHEFKPDLLVPTPLSWRRRWRRGFNQSTLIAQYLQRDLLKKIPIFEHIRRKHTRPQARQGSTGRTKFLETCFSVGRAGRLNDKKVLLIDDVMTSGATANALSAALLKKGVGKIQVFVLARTRRKIV